VALKSGGRPLAMVTVDGGDGYWNPHPGDDPMAMVVHELIPRCQRLGLGRPPHRVVVMGISMGGYGALLLAERYRSCSPPWPRSARPSGPAIRKPGRPTRAPSRRPPRSPPMT